MVKVTQAAIDQIATLNKKQGEYLRIYIKGGGCAGMQYIFEIAHKDRGDTIIEDSIIIDPLSLPYLEDSTLDFTTDIMGSIFTITNPHATTTCGCGESFGV